MQLKFSNGFQCNFYNHLQPFFAHLQPVFGVFGRFSVNYEVALNVYFALTVKYAS